MQSELLQILRHSLGLASDGGGNQYRNHYCAGGDDVELCRQLVSAGYMEEHRPSALTGGSILFTVTIKGKEYLAGLPKPRPLTRARKRYLEYLRSDCGLTFIEYVKRRYGK